MSSARASIGRLQSRLAFIPDEEPEPEAAAAAAAAPSVTANIISAITDRVDANRVDTSVVFQTAMAGGPLGNEFKTLATNIESSLALRLESMIKTSDLPDLALGTEDDRDTMVACTGKAWQAMYPSPEVTALVGAAYQRVVDQCNEYIAEVDAHVATGIDTAIAESAAEVAATFCTGATAPAEPEIATTVSLAGDGSKEYMESTRTLHEMTAVITLQERRIKHLRIELEKKSKARYERAAGTAADLAPETALTNEIKIDQESLHTLVVERNATALETLGRARSSIDSKSITNRQPKDMEAALKKIEKLRLGDFAKGAPPTTAAADLKDALIKLISANIDKFWAMAPTIARMKEYGIGTWRVATNTEMSLEDIEIPEAATTEEKIFQVVNRYSEFGLVPQCAQGDFDALTAQQRIHLAQTAKEAAHIYITQNSALYDVLRADVGKSVTDVVTGVGLFLGDRSENRRIQSTVGDAATVIEAWLLQTETFGVFAKDDARDGIVHASGNLVMENWQRGVEQFQRQIEESKVLKVELTYHQTIHRYMMKLSQHRPRIAALLHRKWGQLPENMMKNDNVVGHLSLFVGEYRQAMADAVQTDRAMNSSASFKNDRTRLVNRVRVFQIDDEEQDPAEHEATDDTEPAGKKKGTKRWKSRKQKEAIRALACLPPDGDNEQSEFIAVMASNATRGAPPVKSNSTYPSWKAREEHMAIYAKDSSGKAFKCCDIGTGCPWKGCNNSILSQADYNHWRQRQTKRDAGKVGAYTCAVCSKCKKTAFDAKRDITCRDGFVWKYMPPREPRRDAVRFMGNDGGPEYEYGESMMDGAAPPVASPEPEPAPSSAPVSQPIQSSQLEQMQATMQRQQRELELQRREFAVLEREQKHRQRPDLWAPDGTSVSSSGSFTGVNGHTVDSVDVDLHRR